MTIKQKLFAYYYPRLKFNATASAIKAGYSERTAYSQGQRLLKNVEIQKLITIEIRAMLSDVDKLTLKWMEQVKQIAFSDIREVFDDTNNLKIVKDIDDNTALAIESVEVVQSFNKQTEENIYTKKVKMSSKVKGLELLGKYLAILQDNPPEPVDEKERTEKKDTKERIAALLAKRDK